MVKIKLSQLLWAWLSLLSLLDVNSSGVPPSYSLSQGFNTWKENMKWLRPQFFDSLGLIDFEQHYVLVCIPVQVSMYAHMCVCTDQRVSSSLLLLLLLF